VDLEALAQEMQTPRAVSGKAAHFAIATPPPELLPLAILAGIQRRWLAASDAWSGYADPSGVPALRAAIARRLLTGGVTVSPDEIVVTTGTMEALLLALRATCRPGDVVACESPMYFGILQLIGSLGLRVVEVPTHPQDGMQLDALRETMDEHPVRAVIAITSFSNPIGSCMSDAARRELVAELAERDIPLIEDDIYGELPHHGTRRQLARAFDHAPDRESRVVVCGSGSKIFSPGMRVGWVVGGRYTTAIRHLKRTSSFASTTLPQLALADYLEHGAVEQHLRRLRHACGERCVAMADAILATFPEGTRTTRPTGGFSLWVELPRSVDALDLQKLALADDITIAPGHLFSAKRRYQHFIRLNAAAYTPELFPRVEHLGKLVGHLARGR
jgi:DNA-binding transcriptional MocR family regulator